MSTAAALVPQMDLLSDIPGRQRWRVPRIDSRPRLAAAVESALRKESGILLAKANPLTGRVLVKWEPGQRRPEIRSIIRKALETGPLSEKAYAKLRGAPDRQVRKLIGKLVLGGIKLSLVFRHLAWGSRRNRSPCRSHPGDVSLRHDHHGIRFPASALPHGRTAGAPSQQVLSSGRRRCRASR